MEKVTLCYCANRNMHLPLCVSAYTALLHLSKGHRLDLHVFQNDFQEKERAKLRQCLNQLGKDYSLAIKPISLKSFENLDALHGDRTTWGRLLLPEMLPDREKIIYLDADTVVLTDLAALHRQDLGSEALGAIPGGVLKHALDHKFFQTVDLDLDSASFNAGVLLFGVDRWLQEGWDESVISFAEKHRGKYLSHDQSVLNCVFNKNFFHLPKKFNRRAYPTGKLTEDEAEDSVLHFVGSPKPWDLFGSLIHDNHEYFDRHADRAGVENSFWHKLRWENLKRTIQIARSYYGHAKKKWERSR